MLEIPDWTGMMIASAFPIDCNTALVAVLLPGLSNSLRLTTGCACAPPK